MQTHVYIAVRDFGTRKKNIWNLTIVFQFSPPHPDKGQILTPGKA